MTQPISMIAKSLVRERQRTGLSLAEIARRAGIATRARRARRRACRLRTARQGDAQPGRTLRVERADRAVRAARLLLVPEDEHRRAGHPDSG